METTNPYPPPVSPHEEVEKDNLQPPITGSPSALLPVDDVESISPSLITSPENLVDHRQLPPLGDGDVQPEIAGSSFLSSPALLIAHHHDHQLFDSISPNLLPLPKNLVHRQLPPPQEDHQEPAFPPSPPPPEDKCSDAVSPSPPSTEAEHPSENLGCNGESPLSKQQPSPSPTPPENLGFNGESPLSKQPPSPSLLPPENLGFNHEYPPENVSLNHESQLKQPPSPSSSLHTKADYPPEKSSPNNECQLSKQPPSPSPEYLPENVSSNHESPLSKLAQSTSLSPAVAEADYSPENLSPNHETPLPKQPAEAPEKPPSPTGPEKSPNHRINPNSDHESPSSPVQLQGNPNPSPKLKQSPKVHSPSPPLDTPEPNTRTPPLGVPLLLHAAATFSPSKPQISPWTHQETANLIQAYQEKWYSLKKGPLKAGQWEEVAITVAARCGYDEPTKTSKQCRHKIEKLRKRYRTERGKPRSKATAWNFFKLMDNLEKGPLPISSSQPMELVEYQKPSTTNGKKRKNDFYDDDDDDDDAGDLANKRSSTSRARNPNHHVANGGLATNLRFSEGGKRIVRGLRTPVIHKRKGVHQEEREEENNENVCEEEEDVAGQLAAEIKGFAEKFVKMENKKIEMMRDVERYRLEMETKRMEMIIESQQILVETVNNAFGSSVKTHRLSAS